LLKKLGIKKVEALVLDEHEKTILKQLGFKLTSKTLEGKNYTKEL